MTENDMSLSEQKGDSTEKCQKFLKLAWGITGAGDLLPETFEIMKNLKKKGSMEITAILSQAAVKVVKTYRLWDTLPTIADKILLEKDANTPFISGALQTGKFDALLVAPMTGNSVAKIVHGIADTLITNAVAMTNKTTTQVFIMPVEREGNEIMTTLPNGSKLQLSTRDLDAQNTAKLGEMKGISVLDGPEDIQRIFVTIQP